MNRKNQKAIHLYWSKRKLEKIEPKIFKKNDQKMKFFENDRIWKCLDSWLKNKMNLHPSPWMIWIFLWMEWIFTKLTLLMFKFTLWCTNLLHHQKCKKNWFASHGTNDTKFNFRNSPRFYNQNAFYLIINFHILSLHKLFPWLYHIMYMLWIALYSIHCKWYFTNSKGFIHVVSYISYKL